MRWEGIPPSLLPLAGISQAYFFTGMHAKPFDSAAGWSQRQIETRSSSIASMVLEDRSDIFGLGHM